MLIINKRETLFSGGFRLCKQENGLTLLEVVICLALLSILLLSFSILFNYSLDISNEAGRISQASFLAQEEMEKLLSNSYTDLLALGVSLNGGSFPASSTPKPLGAYDEFLYSYSIAYETLIFNGYPVQGLRLEVLLILQEDGRQIAKFTTFVQDITI